MAQKSSHLQRWVERAADVPVQLRRNFKLIRELDEKVHELQTDTAGKCRAIVTGVLGKTAPTEPSSGSPAPKKHKTEEKSEETALRAQLDRTVALAEEKYRVAVQLYEFVDDHIRKLDVDYQALDQEINSEYNRLNLVDEEQAPGTGTQRKKRGRKGEKEEEAVVEAPVLPAAAPAGDLALLEPKYCICNGVSHGQMVGCDNENCPIEWFHFECVGLTAEPSGKWYCPNCRKELGLLK